jgi:hypothetical protein
MGAFVFFCLGCISMYCGWFFLGLWLFIFADLFFDAAACDAEDERKRKKEEEEFAHLYPIEFEEKKRRVANMKIAQEKAEIERKEAEKEAALKDYRDKVREFENFLFK